MDKVIADAAQMVTENNKAAQMMLQQGTPEAKLAEAEYMKATTDREELDHKRKVDFAKFTVDAFKAETERLEAESDATIANKKINAEDKRQVRDSGLKLMVEAVKNLMSFASKDKNKGDNEKNANTNGNENKTGEKPTGETRSQYE